MKHFALVIATALALSSAAGAQKYVGTPAQDLFDQASFFLEFNYHGFSTQNIGNLIAKYQAQIDTICARTPTDCAYKAAWLPIANMIRELQDPHSYFVPAEVAEQFAGQLNGTGTGAPSLELNTAKLKAVSDRVVTDVREDGPAGKAGLRRGDRIIAINKVTLPATRRDNENLIPTLEEQGKPIIFSILRGGQEKLEITATPVVVASAWLPEAKTPNGLPTNTAIIRIHEFSPFKVIGTKFHELVNAAEKAGATNIVVDLRDDPGGNVTECTSAAGAFLPEVNNTLETRYSRTFYTYKNGVVAIGNGQKMTEAYRIANPAQFKGKVAVLVSSDSASCAEFFPAEIQYTKRGIVVGEETYGILNTATKPFNFSDGSILGLTTARSLRPDGQPFAERVKPDIEYQEDLEALANGRDVILEKALEALGGKTSVLLSQPTMPKALQNVGGL